MQFHQIGKKVAKQLKQQYQQMTPFQQKFEQPLQLPECKTTFEDVDLVRCQGQMHTR
jgi:hypothetical protein